LSGKRNLISDLMEHFADPGVDRLTFDAAAEISRLQSALTDSQSTTDRLRTELSDALTREADLKAELAQALRERDEARRLVYVPGLRTCAKCGLNLITSTLYAQTGNIAADNSPQDCLNGCGPMWPKTERQAGNELIDRMDAIVDERNASQAESARLRKALEEVEACFDAAFAEGLAERMAELDDHEVGSLKDLLDRRVLFALTAVRSALQQGGGG
jgi:hypothetical protein